MFLLFLILLLRCQALLLFRCLRSLLGTELLLLFRFDAEFLIPFRLGAELLLFCCTELLFLFRNLGDLLSFSFLLSFGGLSGKVLLALLLLLFLCCLFGEAFLFLFGSLFRQALLFLLLHFCFLCQTLLLGPPLFLFEGSLSVDLSRLPRQPVLLPM